jgi:spore coat protein CotH
MSRFLWLGLVLAVCLTAGVGVLSLGAQDPNRGPGGPPPFGPGGPGGPGGPPGPPAQDREIVEQFDKDSDGRLNTAERKAAREFLKTDRAANGGRQGQSGPGFGGPGQGGPGGGPGPGGPPPGGPGGPGFGPPGGGRPNQGKPKAGQKLSPKEVTPNLKSALYDPTALRTFFLEFESKDWEAELADFYGTDVEVPATLTVDGKVYPNVGVHFRGASSYFRVSEGFKRSLNVKLDFVDKKQELYGYKTLNLLNANDDPSFLHTVLYSHLASKYLPVPKANYAKVAINGENWGVYVNAQQFDKVFLKEHFKTDEGTRWKVKGSPRGGGGLDYLGENIEDYKSRYQMKSADNEEAWKALVSLCQVLSETPSDQLETVLEPILDIDSTLWFLALDNALINNDGYWVRASDYSIYRDVAGKFHIIPHDTNETFQPVMGPPPGGGPRGPGGTGQGGPGQRGRGQGGPGQGGPGQGGPGQGRQRQRGTGENGQGFNGQNQGGPGGPGPGGPGQGGPGQGGPGQGGPGQGGPGQGGPGQGGPGQGGPGQGGPGQGGPGQGGPGQGGPGQGGPGQGGPGFGGPGFGGPPPGGPGFGGPGMGGPGFGGPGSGGVELDPLVGMEDMTKPLRSKLLAVPGWKTQYLKHVKTIADDWLDWKKLKPVVDQYVKLIDREVETDTRKLAAYPVFKKAVGAGTEMVIGAGHPTMSIGAFVQQRRKYLVTYPEIKKLGKTARK